MPLLGLVKVLPADARGHVYGVGFVPPGEFRGEIGAIESEPGPDRVPAWLTADGLLVLRGGSAAEVGSSLPRRVRSVLDPLCRGGAYRSEHRLKLMAWRLRRWRTRLRINPSAQPPSGYVYIGPGEGRIPLFEGVHPATGDQLLASDPREIEDRRSGSARLLGYIDPSAPLTGISTSGGPPLPWAQSESQPASTDVWAPPCPGAHVDEPAPGAQVDRLRARVRGWAMFPSESVTRVELTVDGQAIGLARIGLPRSDVTARCGCADAPISGWDYELGNAGVVPASGPITLGGTVYGSAGGTFSLPSVTVHIVTQARAPHSTGEHGPLSARSAISGGRDAAITSPHARQHWPGVGNGLNILVFTHSLTYGGAQLYLVELLERLSKHGLRFTVVSPADGPLRERLERTGAAVHLSPAPVPWEHRMYDARVAELTAVTAPRSFDLVVVNTIGVFYGVDVAARLGLPSILAVHESLDPSAFWAHYLAPHDPAVLDKLRSALASASTMVFEAAATRELFLPYADPERLLTMPYGIDLGAIDRFRATITRRAARSALGIGLEKKVVLCLGTIEPRKGQASLARAFARVAERFPEAVLALVGRGDEPWTESYVDCVEQHLLRKGMLDRVLIRPLTSDPFEWHVAADVLVCASDNESLPRVILEAMAFGRLVVSTDIFGIPEVVEDGVTGFLCRSRDEHEIAEKLNHALDARPQHREICTAATERVRQRHDADAYAAGLYDLFHAIVDERSAVSALAL